MHSNSGRNSLQIVGNGDMYLQFVPSAPHSPLVCQVRIYGPDPKEKLSKGRAFFDACDGISVLSASGCVAGGDNSCVRIVTSASLLV